MSQVPQWHNASDRLL